MVQDLTDVLCTAGKQSAVLPLVPFQFSSAISLSNLPPPHFPLSLFSSHCLSLILSLTLFPFHLHLYPLPYFNTPSISLSQFGLLPLPIYSPATVPFPFSFYPLPHSSSIFPFSLFPSHCFSLPSSPSHYSLFRGFNNSLVAGRSTRLQRAEYQFVRNIFLKKFGKNKACVIGNKWKGERKDIWACIPPFGSEKC